MVYDGQAKALEHENVTAKERIRELLETQPDDASYDEILRELAFERMVERGLADVRGGRVVSNEEMGRRIQRWQS
ncbi:MAG: hypothetical protein JW741_28965 [Sedimentisphaerales bacterium]|nr:hypothetical protein [Sedimentisphaerales bacterium]